MAERLHNAKQISDATGVSKRTVERRLSGIVPAKLEPHPGHPIRWYSLASLPGDYRNALLVHNFAQEEKNHEAEGGASGDLVGGVHDGRAGIPAPRADADDLDIHQREVAAAQARIVGFVADFTGSAQAAIDYLNGHRAAGTLPRTLAWAYDHAWDKPRKNSRLNLSTLNKWKGVKKQRGSHAPMKRQPDMSVKPWHPLAIALRQRPQGSSLEWVAEQIEAQWDKARWGSKPKDVYSVLWRFFNHKFSQIDQLKGRHTGSALRSHKFYQNRTSEGLVPAMEVHADGWNTHFTAPHPVTGEFVTYEVWHFHDVATRYVTPPGLGLTEKFEVIAKGLENFIRVFGVPLIVQTDSTKIVRGSERFTKDPVRSIEERVGCTIVHPKEVGNSQANGICENFNVSYLDKRSRELATFQAKDMDTLTFKRVKKITAAMVKAANAGDLALRDKMKREAERIGKGLVFSSNEEAVEWINRIHAEYNDRPNRSLKKVADPSTGRKRHQTPREALQEHIANGWEPTLMGDTQEAHETFLVDTFRPRVIVKVTRETVSPYGGMRFRNAEVLGHWNGKEVVVVYDIHEWRSVRVEQMNGALICIAEFVSATGYRAVTAYEDAEEKRARAQIRRREKQIAQIEARNPTAAIEEKVDGEALTVIDFPAVEREPELVEIEPLPLEKPQELGSYMDTVMMLYGGKEEESDGEIPEDEVAAL